MQPHFSQRVRSGQQRASQLRPRGKTGAMVTILAAYAQCSGSQTDVICHIIYHAANPQILCLRATVPLALNNVYRFW
jgi:hypothetical protein